MLNKAAPSDNCSGPAGRPLYFNICTDEVPERERFDFFRDVVAARFLGLDDAECRDRVFHGRINGRSAGDVLITYVSSTPARWTRSRKALLDGDESIVLALQHRGHPRLNVAGRELTAIPGSVVLIPTTVPCEKEVFETYETYSVKLPRAAIETSLRPGTIIEPMIFDPNDRAIKLMVNYVFSYIMARKYVSDGSGEIAGRHIADLVAVALGANRDAEAWIENRGLKAARVDAILGAIAQNYATPFISPSTIGSSIGISERHVHRLLEETNRTFYEHLLEARLSCAYRLLSDPTNARRTVADIATKAGFSNVSYFSRVFRTRFGDTPSGVRPPRH